MIATNFNHESREQSPNNDDSAEPPDTEIQCALGQLINDKKYGRPSIVLRYLLDTLSSDTEERLPSEEKPEQDQTITSTTEKWANLAQSVLLAAHYKYDNRGWRFYLLRCGVISLGEKDTLTPLGKACLAALETQSIIDHAQAQASKKRKPHITPARELPPPEISS